MLATKLFRRLVTTLSAAALVLASLAAPANAADFVSKIFYSLSSSSIQSMEFTAYNPANPSESKTLCSGTQPHDTCREVPAGWLVNGEIVMKPGYTLWKTGSVELPLEEFDGTTTGTGGEAILTHTLPDSHPQRLGPNC